MWVVHCTSLTMCSGSSQDLTVALVTQLLTVLCQGIASHQTESILDVTLVLLVAISSPDSPIFQVPSPVGSETGVRTISLIILLRAVKSWPDEGTKTCITICFRLWKTNKPKHNKYWSGEVEIMKHLAFHPLRTFWCVNYFLSGKVTPCQQWLYWYTFTEGRTDHGNWSWRETCIVSHAMLFSSSMRLKVICLMHLLWNLSFATLYTSFASDCCLYCFPSVAVTSQVQNQDSTRTAGLQGTPATFTHHCREQTQA